jgi:hypothetical protein
MSTCEQRLFAGGQPGAAMSAFVTPDLIRALPFFTALTKKVDAGSSPA